MTSEKRDQVVTVKFTPTSVKRLDILRGGWSRSEYIRRSLSIAAKGGLKGPDAEVDL